MKAWGCLQITRLKFEPEHGQSYNDLVEVIARNLLLADWWDEDHSESLLAPRNSKWGAEMLRNVRLDLSHAKPVACMTNESCFTCICCTPLLV